MSTQVEAKQAGLSELRIDKVRNPQLPHADFKMTAKNGSLIRESLADAVRIQMAAPWTDRRRVTDRSESQVWFPLVQAVTGLTLVPWYCGALAALVATTVLGMVDIANATFFGAGSTMMFVRSAHLEYRLRVARREKNGRNRNVT